MQERPQLAWTHPLADTDKLVGLEDKPGRDLLESRVLVSVRRFQELGIAGDDIEQLWRVEQTLVLFNRRSFWTVKENVEAPMTVGILRMRFKGCRQMAIMTNAAPNVQVLRLEWFIAQVSCC